MTEVAIVIFTKRCHIGTLAAAALEGIEQAGGHGTIFEIDIPPREPNDCPYPPILPDDLKKYNAFLFGIPSYFGNYPAKWKAFWDITAQTIFKETALAGKFAGIFVSTSYLGGGQEITIMNSLSCLVHHGIIFVPLGYRNVAEELNNLKEVHGGSPWGAGTLAGDNNERLVTELERTIARKQGIEFWKIISKYNFQ